MVIRVAPALLAIALAACASPQGTYPSLAVRDAERATGTLQPPEPYVPVPPSAAAMNDVENLVEQAHAAFESYRDKLDGVRRAALAARGAEVGSDAWARASVAIAGLETERSRTMVPLADIDRMLVAAATEGARTAEFEDAQALIGEMVDFETAGINEIRNALR